MNGGQSTDERRVNVVYAWWNRTVWQYSYVEPCPTCGRIHTHGGGNGDQPDLAIGGEGGWGSHCPDAAVQVLHRLVGIVPRDVTTMPEGGTASERGLAGARAWREATFIPCVVCPPHPSGELTKHKRANFHARRLEDCVICTPHPDGMPRRHRVARHHPGRAIRHVTNDREKSAQQ